MPTIISHVAVPLAVRWGLGPGLISARLLLLAMFCSILPDLDVIAFRFGIPYESQWGHRGFTHSLAFAALVGLLFTALAPYLKVRRLLVFVVLFVATASHALLDAATDGGLGCALFWPFDDARYFLPWTPIEVSPIGVSNFLSARGAVVLASELYWVWLPALGMALLLAGIRLQARRRRAAVRLGGGGF